MSGDESAYNPARIYRRLLAISGRHWLVFIGVIASASVFAATDAGFAYLMKTLTEIVDASPDLDSDQLFVRRWLPLASAEPLAWYGL